MKFQGPGPFCSHSWLHHGPSWGCLCQCCSVLPICSSSELLLPCLCGLGDFWVCLWFVCQYSWDGAVGQGEMRLGMGGCLEGESSYHSTHAGVHMQLSRTMLLLGQSVRYQRQGYWKVSVCRETGKVLQAFGCSCQRWRCQWLCD